MMDVTPKLPSHRENLYTVSYRNELKHFLRACAGEVVQPPPREQVDVMRIIELGYRSAAERREVPVQVGA